MDFVTLIISLHIASILWINHDLVLELQFL